MSYETDLVNLWLSNMQNLDDKNHLEHGKIYASDGSVKSFEINSNVVTATIEGAPEDFYNVKLTFKALEKDKERKLTKQIKDNLQMQADMLNNIIPRDIIETNNIIPESIKDFKMECDCKNKGLFCKHKATLFHYLAKELSKNPFLLFNLRDYPIDNILNQSEKNHIKNVKDLLKYEKKTFKKGDNIDFDDIPPLTNTLKFLLDEYSGFYTSSTISFKSIILDVLSEFAESIQQINSTFNKYYKHYINFRHSLKLNGEDLEEIYNKKWFNPSTWDEFHIDIDENYNIVNLDKNLIDKFNIKNTKHAFFALFCEMKHVDNDDYCDDLKFFHKIYRLTSELIYKNALVPEFFQTTNNEYAIRWIPQDNELISDIINNLACECSKNIVTLNGKPLDKDKQIICVISLFFSGFVVYELYNTNSKLIKNIKNNEYFQLFFVKSQKFKVKGIENIINNWLNPLFVKENKLVFSINVIQDNEEFILNIYVTMNNEKFTLNELLASENNKAIIRHSNMLTTIFSKHDFDFNLNETIRLGINEFMIFNDFVKTDLEKNGIEVTLPDELTIEKRAKLTLNSDEDISKTSLTLEDLNKFDWKIAIGDETFSLNEFESLSKRYNGLVKINDRYLKINEEDLLDIDYQTDLIPTNPTRNDMMHFILSGDIENLDIGINDKLSNLINNLFEVDPITIPESLNGELRPYQKIGFSWLCQNIKIGFGSILADDMGLGKTIQVLTAILYMKENNMLNGDVLIIAPKSLLSNWQKEIEKFTPSLTSVIYHGINRQLPEDNIDIILTSYGMIRQDIDIINEKLDIYLCVVDEAQNIKNPNTKQTKAIKSIKAKNKIALSGTPVENRLSDYWSIFDFISKGYLYTLKIFNEKFIKPIENEHDRTVLNNFKKITSPFILRRNKTDKDIMKDLPDKIVNDVYCNLTVNQAAMYEETLNANLRDVENSEGINRKGLILKLITSLKQICNHPAQFSKTKKMNIKESGKMEVLINILENILDNDEKAIIFTQYVEMGEIIKKLVSKYFNQEVLFFKGSLSLKKRDEMIEKFQNNKTNKIMVLSLKAGGTGLNLTAAQNVIHYDLWWNPAIENQATDRAYRIGQENNVMVHRFIVKGTFEERINKILSEKTELSEIVIDNNETTITEMTTNELKEILRLRQI